MYVTYSTTATIFSKHSSHFETTVLPPKEFKIVVYEKTNSFSPPYNTHLNLTSVKIVLIIHFEDIIPWN